MKTLLQFLGSKLLLKNVIIALLLFIVGFFVMNFWMKSYTRHGDYITVPDLSSYSLGEVEEELEAISLSYEVIDSGMHNPEYPRGSVVEQIPSAYAEVKKDRTIYLTINPRKTKKIPIPNLIDKSKRQGFSYLESVGFKVGELEYIPDVARDVVLKMKVDGEEVEVGELFPSGTRVDLVLGMGLSNEKIQVPWLMGLNLEETKVYVRTYDLNCGAVSWDEEITDSATAVVYRQYPGPSLKKVIQMGGQVDVWMTSDTTKVPVDTIYQEVVKDTLLIDPSIMEGDSL